MNDIFKELNDKMRDKKELTPETKKTVEVISKVIAVVGGGAFCYWVLTAMEII